MIRDGLVDRWGRRPIGSITSDDVHGLVDEARRIGTPGMVSRVKEPSDSRAREMFAALSALFGWLHRQRLVGTNPAAGVFPPPPAPPRDRVLSHAEIGRLWRAAETAGTFGAVVRLLLVTGCRLSEVAGMRWGELSDDGASFSIPASRSKNRRAHVVPLPPIARAIIAHQPRIDRCDLVFTTNRRTAIRGFNKPKRALAAVVAANAPWTLHDLRRTAATEMAEIGIRTDVIELCLNHVSGMRAGVAGIYNRSELLPERRAALEAWAHRIEAIVNS